MFKILEDRLGLVCPHNGMTAEFLTITVNKSAPENMAAFVSTLPLYYAGNASAGTIYLNNLNNSVTNYVEVWYTADNGASWTKRTSGSITNMSYNSSSQYWTFSSTGGFGFAQYTDILYSNYPILYSCRKHSSASSNANFNTTKDRPLYKDSSVPYSLKMLPYGATIRFGRYKRDEASENVYDLFWYVQEYTRRHVDISPTANYPKDSVYLSCKHIIDVLPYNNYKNYQYSNAYDGNANLPKYLNGTKGANQWWYSSGDGDYPPTAENQHDSYKNYAYNDKAGFLHRFTNGELSLMQSTELDGIKFKTDHVSLFNWAEFYTSRTMTQTHSTLLSVSGFAHNRYYHVAMSEGKNAVSAALINDKYTINKYSADRWCRNKQTVNQGYKHDGSSKLSYGYESVVPICFIADSTMVKGIDEEGFFTLEMPDVAEPTEYFYDTEINIVNSFENKNDNTERRVISTSNSSYDSAIYTIKSYENSFDVSRSVGALFKGDFNADRRIVNSFKAVYQSAVLVRKFITKFYETSRMRNYVFTPSFESRRRVTANYDRVYQTERNTNEEYNVDIKYSTERRIVKKYFNRFNTALVNLGSFDKEYLARRYTQANVDISYNTSINTVNHREFNYPLQRLVQKNFKESAATRVRCVNSFESIFNTKRDSYIQHIFKYETKRSVINNHETCYLDVARYLSDNSENLYPTFLYIAEPVEAVYEADRRICERHVPKYPTVRLVKKDMEFTNTFEVERNICESYEELFNTCTSILADFEKINETVISIFNNVEMMYNVQLNITEMFSFDTTIERKVLCMSDDKYPTNRSIINTSNKYVSRDNLMLYTLMLKQEISELIQVIIDEELKKRGL